MNDFKSLLITAFPHLAAIFFFVILNSILYYPQLQGLQIQQHDTIEFAIHPDLQQERKELGRTWFWNNTMFSGVPAFFHGLNFDSALRTVDRAFHLFFSRPIGTFTAYMIIMYIAMLCLGVSPLYALISAVGCGMATNNLILFEAGHMMKVGTLLYFPFILAGVILMLREKYQPGFLLYTLGLALSIMWHHVQMKYYLALCLVILGIVYLIYYARSGKLSVISKVLGFAILGTLLAVATNTAQLWSSIDYSQETMRGGSILESAPGAQGASQTTTGGLDWDYAMAWSNNTVDVLAGIIPGIAGGGSGERIKSGPAYDAFRRGGVGMQADGSIRVPTYWGALPFTSGAIYFGAVLMFLFMLALYTVQGPLKWSMALAVLFTIFISYGKNMETFQRILFDFIPLFNKFRTPNSVLSVTSIIIPLFGALGLYEWIKNHREKGYDKKLYYAAGITAGFCLLIAVFGSQLFSFSGVRDEQLQQQGILDIIIDQRKYMMQADAFRSFLLIMTPAILLWLYLRSKLGLNIILPALLVLIIFDFWGVNKRYVNPTDFKDGIQTLIADYYQLRDVDRQIMNQETSRHEYRVLDLSINTFNTNKTSYYHNTIGGYSAAKLQRYQDLIDRHLSRLNLEVLNMLNAKYIIDQNGQLQQNSQALGNVWFVSEIQPVNSANAEIDALNNINTAQTALVHIGEFGNYIQGLQPDGIGSISQTGFESDRWIYRYETNSEQLAVFSEIWYPEAKGMKVYINGERVPLLRANYALRALRVPAGSGEILFAFEPRTYIIGQPITRITSVLLILMILGWIGYTLYTRRQTIFTPIEKNAIHEENTKPVHPRKGRRKK